VSAYDNSSYNPGVAGSGRAANNGTTGDYRLYIGLMQHKDVGDTLRTALDTGLGPVSGSYTMPWEVLGNGRFSRYDVDLYRFRADAGGTLTAQTSLPAGGVSPTDTYLRLFDSHGAELANNDNNPSGGTLYSLLSFTFSYSGTYYIGVSGAPNTSYDPNVLESGVAGRTGDYSLSLNLVPGRSSSPGIASAPVAPPPAGIPASDPLPPPAASGRAPTPWGSGPLPVFWEPSTGPSAAAVAGAPGSTGAALDEYFAASHKTGVDDPLHWSDALRAMDDGWLIPARFDDPVRASPLADHSQN
jgi:hypothetical protein